ncbi:hypothetical protein CNYM01_11233 [Colletotrichum nymphaeae SA-01]|uniref:Uncharacterized protein n=1 Tax=Colletotrichum nymphaeae SA-01 TaxID=1460502 RepID=A0A135TUI1_9PEZI|nr:hypothetical protein CNYM01_11233 [Colletotrichum nymphaeae SA-01]
MHDLLLLPVSVTLSLFGRHRGIRVHFSQPSPRGETTHRTHSSQFQTAAGKSKLIAWQDPLGSRPPTNGPLEDWAALAFAGRASRQVLHLLISSGRVSRLSKLPGPATNLHLRISTSPIVFNDVACAVAFVCSSAPVPSLLYQLRQPTTQSPLSLIYRLRSTESQEYALKVRTSTTHATVHHHYHASPRPICQPCHPSPRSRRPSRPPRRHRLPSSEASWRAPNVRRPLLWRQVPASTGTASDVLATTWQLEKLSPSPRVLSGSPLTASPQYLPAGQLFGCGPN